MNKPRPIVLIGDVNPGRRNLFREVLGEEFLAQVQFADTWEAMRELVRQHASERLHFVLVAEDLPTLTRNGGKGPPRQLYEMLLMLHEDSNLSYAEMGYIAEDGLRYRPVPDPIKVQPCILPGGHAPAANRTALISYFGRKLDQAPKPPVLKLQDHDDTLVLQVRHLDAERNLAQGIKILAVLCREFFACDRLLIQKLAQGLSGASVFRVSGLFPDPGGPRNHEFVIKLCLSLDDAWKLEYEAEGHARAARTLGYPGVASHVPHIVMVPEDSNAPFLLHGNPRAEPKPVVRSDRHCAICYGFLGGELGPMLELERALTESAADLAKACENTKSAATDYAVAFRVDSLERILGWLSDQWYGHRDKHVRKLIRPWSQQDAPEKQYPPFPPYALTGKSRGMIEAFLLNGWNGLGPKLLPGWAAAAQSLRDLLLAPHETGIPLLDREINCLLSPAHGDLNAKNVFLWLNHPSHPFLIDFPFFQEQGHALQDFARLEVEIMLAILDRQEIPGVPAALDYTHTQLPLWMKWLDHLLGAEEPAERTAWDGETAIASANLCLTFVRLIRRQAVRIQKLAAVDLMPSFFEEYLPALLYHTVRAIRYDSISPFKRLLAVYGAGQIIGKLQRLSVSS